MTKIVLLCAILAALCGAANAQYSDPSLSQLDRDYLLQRQLDDRDFYLRQDFERQLQQQRDEAQSDRWRLEEQNRNQQLNGNFGCDIHNHCR